MDDLKAALEAVKMAGGGAIGNFVSLAISGAGTVAIVDAKDPAGNTMELQTWSKEVLKQ